MTISVSSKIRERERETSRTVQASHRWSALAPHQPTNLRKGTRGGRRGPQGAWTTSPMGVVWSACRVEAARSFCCRPGRSRGGCTTAAATTSPAESDEGQPQYLPPTNGRALPRSSLPAPYPLLSSFPGSERSPAPPCRARAVTHLRESPLARSKTLADQKTPLYLSFLVSPSLSACGGHSFPASTCLLCFLC